MISRFYSPSAVAQAMEGMGGLQGITGRCSGDSLGLALTTIGCLMQKTKSYSTPKLDNDTYDAVKYLVIKLELKYFVLDNKTRSVTYDVWWPE